MLEFQVNDRLPGSSLDVKAGSKVRISATAYGHPSQIPLSRVEIIGHGKILAEATPDGAGQTPGRLSVELELGVEHGIWLAARTDAGLGQIAHTTPVYVTVNGDGFHNRANLTAQIEASKRYLQEIRDLFNPSAEGANWQAVLYSTPSPALYRGAKEKLERRIAEAEAKLEALRGRR